jgi:hypothetical protein
VQSVLAKVPNTLACDVSFTYKNSMYFICAVILSQRCKKYLKLIMFYSFSATFAYRNLKHFANYSKKRFWNSLMSLSLAEILQFIISEMPFTQGVFNVVIIVMFACYNPAYYYQYTLSIDDLQNSYRLELSEVFSNICTLKFPHTFIADILHRLSLHNYSQIAYNNYESSVMKLQMLKCVCVGAIPRVSLNVLFSVTVRIFGSAFKCLLVHG